ncbi:MAG: DDE-type integrase/transposase/recombinase [Acetobacteraceae bacterium]|nr:DDE-type integrase/transposase/recombinase [Acetobacteraceae bacterium]
MSDAAPRYRFQIGAEYRLHGFNVTYVKRNASTQPPVHVFRQDDGYIHQLSDAEAADLSRSGKLRRRTGDPGDGEASRQIPQLLWQTAPTEFRALALFKLHFVQAVMEGGGMPPTDEAQRDLAKRIHKSAPKAGSLGRPPSPRTLRTWLRRYREFGLEGLLPQTYRCGNRSPRLTAEARRLMIEVVEKTYLSERRLAAAAVHSLLEAAVNARNETNGSAEGAGLLKCPSVAALRRYIRKELCPFAAEFTRYGAQAAARKFKVVTGCDHPTSHNDVWQIDHTLLNVMVRRGRRRHELERPWLTTVIDVHSRVFVGFWIGFEAPSVEVACRALLVAILPKEKLLARHGAGVRSPWPCRNVATRILMDQDTSFKAGNFRERLALLGASVDFSPVIQP